jgi:predicted phosphoadenosine phosphosulfate sulfurtransferase
MGTKHKIKDYISRWEDRDYRNGIPDEAPIELERAGLAPSYRLICIALMKNPNNLESLGYTREKCKIYQEIKRTEIYNREYSGKQLKLFL